jgi:hypothetical protein
VWLQHEGLEVRDVVVLIDREQGGAARMASNNLKLHSAFTLSFIIKVLLRHGLVSQEVAASVTAFIADNQTFSPEAQPASEPSKPKRCSHRPSPAQMYWFAYVWISFPKLFPQLRRGLERLIAPVAVENVEMKERRERKSQ